MKYKKFLQKLFSLIDHTCLNEQATSSDISILCNGAVSNLGEVAAICIYPQYIQQARDLLSNTTVKIATVCNFPNGNLPLSKAIAEIDSALSLGADEIDLVMPYSDFLSDRVSYVRDYLKSCREKCGEDIAFKVILETGELVSSSLIGKATEIAITAGADFIKTSTGKSKIGATPEAVSAILSVISDNPSVGVKISGGVRTVEDVMPYWNLLVEYKGNDWITAETVRFGTSSLVNNILHWQHNL